MKYKISDLYEPIGKKVLYIHTFEPSMVRDENGRYPVTFSAYHAAEAWLKELGYLTGSMESYQPIGFAPANHWDYISKWTRMNGAERRQLHGVMISENFREGNVYVVFCESPLKSLVKVVQFKSVKLKKKIV